VSGFTSDGEMEAALAAGYDRYFGKPIDTTELVEAIHEVRRLRQHR